MRVVICGAGPAGLYAAILLKRTRPDISVRIVEQNPADVTFGFGVVFSEQALTFLRNDDAETADLIEPHMTRWNDIAIVHRDLRIAIDGIGFSGIGRLKLLQLLRRRAAALGIEPQYEPRVTSARQLGPADLVIGADGFNSVVRRSAAAAFGEKIIPLNNRFVWFGAEREFDALSQVFINTAHGPMNSHHYSYAPGHATFLIEMGADTFHAAGFDHMPADECRAECERLFATTLDGAQLLANNSVWRQFASLSCRSWYHANQVLVGDALHTVHFSIGSGTRLALEDVIALVSALKEHDWNIANALPSYQLARQPIVEKIALAGSRSADWYETFGQQMTLDPWRFALSYIRRAGRIDAARLQTLAPTFAADLRTRQICLDP